MCASSSHVLRPGCSSESNENAPGKAYAMGLYRAGVLMRCVSPGYTVFPG
jgi:hypothetical protein